MGTYTLSDGKKVASLPVQTIIVAPSEGPGTELKKLLKKWLGIEPGIKCACNAMAARMNLERPEWSLTNIERIVDVMQNEAARRKSSGAPLPLALKLPFNRTAAEQLVRLAVRLARRRIVREDRERERLPQVTR